MILYIDIHTGISGDMILGAFIDMGVPIDWLRQTLSEKIPLTGFDVRGERVKKHHLCASNVFVDVHDSTTSRHYTDIKSMINDSDLSAKVKIQSLSAFEKIALAESAIHDQDPATVHFHEVGGIDALVDIIGAFLCVEYLNIKTVYASVVPLGSGCIQCSHGNIPVPAPATLSILKGVPVKGTAFNTEIVTPTGAAILTTLTTSFGPIPEMTINNIGYGAGKRDLIHQPNLLRMVTGELLSSDPVPDSILHLETDKVMVIRTNIDDMTPEIFGFLMDRLLEAGALDVSYQPVQMKKNRPGTIIEVLCPMDKKETITKEILTQTSSTGVRYHVVQRSFLKRAPVEKSTRFGTIQVKQIHTLDSGVAYIPEYEVCRGIAEKNHLALKDVLDQVRLDLAAQE